MFHRMYLSGEKYSYYGKEKIKYTHSKDTAISLYNPWENPYVQLKCTYVHIKNHYIIFWNQKELNSMN